MNNIPQTEPTQVAVRSTTDSNAQNKFEKQVLTDLLTLYNKSNLIEIALDNVKEIIDIEDSYMKISAIKTQTMLGNFVQSYINNTTEIKNAIVYPNTIVGIAPNNPKIDLETFDVTILPSYTESKVNIHDEVAGETFIPSSLKVELLMPDTPGLIEVVDNDVYQVFDTRTDTVWLRKIITDNTVSEVTTTMNIYLPYDIVTTDMVNEITIKPFPLNSINIKEIKYSSTYDISYTTAIDELETTSKSILSDYNSILTGVSDESFGIRLNFSERKIKVLTITFSQKNYLEKDGVKVFYIGAKDIAINLNKYEQQYAEFQSDIVLPEGTKEIRNIEYVLNNPLVADQSSFNSQFYSLDSQGIPTLIDSSMPFTTSALKLRVKSKIIPTVENNTPNISKIKISYVIS